MENDGGEIWMEKVFEFKKVGKTNVTVTDKFIKIERKGFMNRANLGSVGEKKISLSSITGVQIKKPGLTNGYIQFIFSGSKEVKGGVFDAVKDENTVMFAKAEHPMALEIQQLIESVIYGEKETGATSQSSSIDPMEQIKKLKELLDMGAISQEEFDTKKQDILERI